MSADNYIYITKKEGQWVGYMMFASDGPLTTPGNPCFFASSLEGAITMAQHEHCEYGYYVDESVLEGLTGGLELDLKGGE